MMMMMKFALVLVLVVAVTVAPSEVLVVQAQPSQPCSGLTKNECTAKTECKFFSFLNKCIPTAGQGSVVRQGEDNFALGTFCTVAGGKQNQVGNGSFYTVSGGGKNNESDGDKTTISGGSDNKFVSFSGVVSSFGSTINGGQSNKINDNSSFSVITGGGGDGFLDGLPQGNSIAGAKESTISGGQSNGKFASTGEGGVCTGGKGNGMGGKESVVTGGKFNNASGRGSVALGGAAFADYSIALGDRAFANKDSSMAINLIGIVPPNDTGPPFLGTTKDGQFLVEAKSYKLQIGNGKNKNGEIRSTKITEENIQNLIDALKVE